MEAGFETVDLSDAVWDIIGFDPYCILANQSPSQRWRPEISTDVLLWNLEKDKHHVEDIVEEHAQTFGQRKKIWAACGFSEPLCEKATPELMTALLKLCGQTPSVFSIQLLQDMRRRPDVVGGI